MKVALLTREYPPEIYGGAGVHVEYLSRELGRIDDLDVEVHCFGADREGARAYRPLVEVDEPWGAALATLSVDIQMAAGVAGADVAHSHTWYANMAGHLAKLTHGLAHVCTTHSLEPHRPWKREQLAGGYDVSTWCERTALESADAVIAVSDGMRDDVLTVYPGVSPERVHVVPNGIDPDEYRPVDVPAGFLEDLGVDGSRPIVLFVGRVTRQKGIDILLRAARSIGGDAQVVVVAGAADTPDVGAEMRTLAEEAGAVWIERMLARSDVIRLYTAADVFVCPSVYEPFGIINLEAMACETAVVATRVGGIPGVVLDGETGLLVDPDAGAIARAVNELLADADLRRRFGAAGRARVLERFSWTAVAAQTAEIYRSLV